MGCALVIPRESVGSRRSTRVPPLPGRLQSVKRARFESSALSSPSRLVNPKACGAAPRLTSGDVSCKRGVRRAGRTDPTAGAPPPGKLFHSLVHHGLSRQIR